MNNIILLPKSQSRASDAYTLMQRWLNDIEGCLAEISLLLSALPPSACRDLLNSEIVELGVRLKVARRLTDDVLPPGRTR